MEKENAVKKIKKKRDRTATKVLNVFLGEKFMTRWNDFRESIGGPKQPFIVKAALAEYMNRRQKREKDLK